jgi:hypothetical protein
VFTALVCIEGFLDLADLVDLELVCGGYLVLLVFI